MPFFGYKIHLMQSEISRDFFFHVVHIYLKYLFLVKLQICFQRKP